MSTFTIVLLEILAGLVVGWGVLYLGWKEGWKNKGG